jgi:peptidoglycan/LPS O-acetylase OafA/YrhL
MASGHKYKRLDSLRGLAALSVGVGHALLCVQLAQGGALRTAVSGIFDGDYAVDLFFVLSGFVLANMVRGFSGAHYAAYLARRFLRLYPLMWAVIVIACFVQIAVAAHAPPCGDLSAWACRLIRRPSSVIAAMASAIPIDCQLDPVTWTIKVEVAVSVVYPFLVAAWMKGGAAGKIALAAATVLIFAFVHRAVPHFLLLFVAGLVLNDIRIANAWQANLAAVTGIILLGICGFFTHGHSAPADLTAGASAMLLIASVAYRCPGWLAAVLDNRACLRLGEISYSYYLLNPIVLWLIARAAARPLSQLLAAGGDGRALLVASLLAACAALATAFVAAAASRWIEKPSIALSRAAEQWVLLLLGTRAAERAPYRDRQSNVV